jgi:hypothetical protein
LTPRSSGELISKAEVQGGRAERRSFLGAIKKKRDFVPELTANIIKLLERRESTIYGSVICYRVSGSLPMDIGE